jgi:hypothetical protein
MLLLRLTLRDSQHSWYVGIPAYLLPHVLCSGLQMPHWPCFDLTPPPLWCTPFYLQCWTNFASFAYDRYLYTVLMTRHFPTYIQGVFLPANVLKATVVDNFLITPMLFFPCYYVFKDVLAPAASGSPLRDGSTSPTKRSVVAALQHYQEEGKEQLSGVWAVWIPAHLVMFSVVPIHLRVAYSNCIAFTYSFVLSFLTARLDKRREAHVSS